MFHTEFPTKEALAFLMKQCNNDADCVHKYLVKYKSIRRRLRQNYEKSLTLQEKHTKKLSEIYSEHLEIENECDHFDIKYLPDPSGNSDSSYECRICGKDVGKNEYYNTKLHDNDCT